jgi:hypothetical protein
VLAGPSVESRGTGQCSRFGDAAQSTRRSTTSIEGSRVTPSLERPLWAVNVFPSSLNTEVQGFRSPLQVHVSPSTVSRDVLTLPKLSKNCER